MNSVISDLALDLGVFALDNESEMEGRSSSHSDRHQTLREKNNTAVSTVFARSQARGSRKTRGSVPAADSR